MRKSDSSKAGIKTAKNTDFQEAPLGNTLNLRPAYSGVASSQITPINLKCSQVLFVDKETGETSICEHLDNGEVRPVVDPVESRIKKWVRLSYIRQLRFKKRVAKCNRVTLGIGKAGVMFSPKLGSAHFSGLFTCASTWDCPVCVAKINERRRIEVKAVMDKWESMGGQCLLLTLTCPHYLTDSLSSLVKGQQKAMSNLTSSRNYKLIRSQTGMVGTIRAWEVTFGDNGWHPHFHILLFVRTGLDLAELEEQFFIAWANACRLAKLPEPSRSHGVDLQDGSQAHGYITKHWGLDYEMTKANSKKGKGGQLHPMQLVDLYIEGNKQAGALFVEYSNAFHGKRQLYWTPGLKDYFGIDDKDDEQVANEIEEDAYLLGLLEPSDWKLVVRSRTARGEILELARGGKWDAVELFLQGLRG